MLSSRSYESFGLNSSPEIARSKIFDESEDMKRSQNVVHSTLKFHESVLMDGSYQVSLSSLCDSLTLTQSAARDQTDIVPRASRKAILVIGATVGALLAVALLAGAIIFVVWKRGGEDAAQNEDLDGSDILDLTFLPK
jgi:hypothetical protein